MHLIIGLGNPGEKYAATRHNAGFMTVDALRPRLRRMQEHRVSETETVSGSIRGRRTVLAKPLTYMNESGRAVARLVSRFQVDPTDRLLVVVDDVNLPLGVLRLRTAGSDGGHNGLDSVIGHLGHSRFARLRLGVGAPEGDGDLADFVLAPFSASEEKDVSRMLDTAADAVCSFISRGTEAAMNTYNNNSLSNTQNEVIQ